MTLTENSSVKKMTPRDFRNIHTTGNSCRDALREHGTKTTQVFLPADGEASRSLLPTSGGTVQPENTYYRILKMTGQFWESQKRISISINHCYHQRLSPLSQSQRI